MASSLTEDVVSGRGLVRGRDRPLDHPSRRSRMSLRRPGMLRADVLWIMARARSRQTRKRPPERRGIRQEICSGSRSWVEIRHNAFESRTCCDRRWNSPRPVTSCSFRCARNSTDRLRVGRARGWTLSRPPLETTACCMGLQFSVRKFYELRSGIQIRPYPGD